MGGILEWLGGLAASGIQFSIGLGSIIGAVAAGGYAMKRTQNPWVAWGVGIGTFIAAVAIMAPTVGALQRVSCHTAESYSACMNGDDSDDSG